MLRRYWVSDYVEREIYLLCHQFVENRLHCDHQKSLILHLQVLMWKVDPFDSWAIVTLDEAIKKLVKCYISEKISFKKFISIFDLLLLHILLPHLVQVPMTWHDFYPLRKLSHFSMIHGHVWSECFSCCRWRTRIILDIRPQIVEFCQRYSEIIQVYVGK